MCYFDQHKWECGVWRWHNFRRHCQAEYRMGETCGMKLVYETIPLAGKCVQCQNIEKKERRLEKAISDFQRWRNEPNRQASAEKAYAEIMQFRREIATMKAEKESRKQNVGNSRRAATAQR